METSIQWRVSPPSLSIVGDQRKLCEDIGDVAPRVIALLEKTHREHESFGLQMNPYSALQVMHGACLGALGKFADGERLCEKGLSFAREISHLFSIAFADYLRDALLLQGRREKRGKARSECHRILRKIAGEQLSAICLGPPRAGLPSSRETRRGVGVKEEAEKYAD